MSQNTATPNRTYLTGLACQRVQALTPYLSARRIGGKGHIFLNANESPRSDEYQLDCSRLNRYPECQPPEVLDRYAAYAGVNSDQVLVSRGSDEAIELLIRTFCEPGQEEILFCPPTYGMYSISAETCGVGMRTLPPLPDFQPDVAAILDTLQQGKPIKVLFFCSPNNPTGTVLQRDKLLAILDATAGKSIVVVDEAYIDFGGETAISLVDLYPNLLVTQTLSKSRSLAGLRVGLAVGHPDLIEALERIKNSFNSYPLDRMAIVGAAAAFEDQAYFEQTCQRVIDSRETVVAGLKQLGFEVLPSAANFVFARHPAKDAATLAAGLREQGVIVRHFKQQRIAQFLRITIGTPEQNQALLDALQGL